MLLLQLPPEILLCILDELGHEFFSKDLSRLTISRLWYDLAWKVFSRDLPFTAWPLIKFTKNETAFLGCQPYIASVGIDLGCPEWWNTTPSPPMKKIYVSLINSASEVLVGMLKRCQSLRCLKIKVGPDCPELDIERPAYLMVKPLAGLLAIQNLTSVVFDTAGCYPFHQPADSDLHICCALSSSLRSLRRLHCRTDTICECLLGPAIQDTPQYLRELIINLSISDLSGSITACRYSKDCQSTARKSFLDLKEAIEGQATTLAHQLENPRMVRVISHEVPSLKVFAFNALTGRRAELENNIEWDADGEEVVEEVEESDDENDRDLFDDDSLPEPWIDLAAESNF